MFKCEKLKLCEMYKVTKFSTPIIVVDYFYKMYVHGMCIKSLIDMFLVFTTKIHLYSQINYFLFNVLDWD